MKKIFTLIAAAILAVGAKAQTDVEWNFSNWDVATFEETTTIEGLTIHATSDKKVSIDENKKTVDGVEYTKRLKFGGSGNINKGERFLTFDVTGPCSIYVVGISASKEETRPLLVTDGTNELGNFELVGTTATGVTASYTGSSAATIYVYSGKSGINLYDIKVTYGSSAGINATNAAAVSADAPLYKLNGQQVGKAYKGVVIQNGQKRIQK